METPHKMFRRDFKGLKLAGRCKYADQHGTVFVPTDMSVDAWFESYCGRSDSEHTVRLLGAICPQYSAGHREDADGGVKPIHGKMVQK